MATKNTVPHYLPLPYGDINSDISDPQKVLSGLGKPTRRGIKKCFNCGVYNGTRKTMCKNKECRVVFKDCEEKSKTNLDAVKLLTGTERQVYSVLARDMGSDYCGFVQLPLLQSHNDEDTNIFSEVALCFVDSCQKSFDKSILKCHEEDQNDSNLLCAHINSALKSQSNATPIEFKDEILHSLNVQEDVKEKLCILATEREGPLVQRVSKSIMAVKCQVSPRHPLGYLHFTFIKAKGSKDFHDNYCCSCIQFIIADSVKDKSSNTTFKCIHYYACIWALASDSTYRDEFSHFINDELSTTTQDTAVNVPAPSEPSSSVVHHCRSNLVNCRSNLRPKSHNGDNRQCAYKMLPRFRAVQKKGTKKSARKPFYVNKYKKLMPRILPIEIKVLNELKEPAEDVAWNFMDWLSYVTESINNTMQFGNCGMLNTLVFHVPEDFYQCFKKRIPSMYEETQTDMSFSYNIMNILHLKEIFDTPLIKLKISKKFVHNEQKGYVEYDENEECGCYQYPFIFFLNVGQSTVDESDNTNNSFLIEWMPALTNLTKVGQLKFQYKCGRKST